MKSRKTVQFVALFGLVFFNSSSHATVIMQTFDELPFQSVDDLSHQGVTFDFKIDGVDSDDAKYGSFGPITTEHVSDPSLVGDSSGILTIEFDIPTSSVEFAVALSDVGPLSPGFVTELFDADLAVIATIPTDTAASAVATGFSDALFHYSGTSVRRVSIDFDGAFGSFAFDNLSYIVPEPSCLLHLLVIALACVVRRGHP